VPSDTKIDLVDLLPEKMKLADKYISIANTVRFQKSKPSEYGLSFAKGYKKLSEFCTTLDWCTFDVITFKPPEPLAWHL
jgi:hypothetical protein